LVQPSLNIATAKMQDSTVLNERSRPMSARSGSVRPTLIAATQQLPTEAEHKHEVNMDKLNYLKREAVKLYNAQDYSNAEFLFQEALVLTRSMYSPNHPECVKAEKSILMVRRKQQQMH
jgi:hypothetical protein